MNKNKILYSIFLVFILFVFGNPVDVQEVQEKKLPIEPIAQKFPLWCWAASAQMIMKYHGKDVPQENQVDDYLNGQEYKIAREQYLLNVLEQSVTGADTNQSIHVPPELVSGIPPVLPDFSRYGLRSEWRWILEWTDLKNQINTNGPFGFSWCWISGTGLIPHPQDEPGGGHYMVAIGYREENGEKFVWIIDPTKIVLPNGEEVPPERELITYDEYKEYCVENLGCDHEEVKVNVYSHHTDQYQIIKFKLYNRNIKETK